MHREVEHEREQFAQSATGKSDSVQSASRRGDHFTETPAPTGISAMSAAPATKVRDVPRSTLPASDNGESDGAALAEVTHGQVTPAATSAPRTIEQVPAALPASAGAKVNGDVNIPQQSTQRLDAPSVAATAVDNRVAAERLPSATNQGSANLQRTPSPAVGSVNNELAFGEPPAKVAAPPAQQPASIRSIPTQRIDTPKPALPLHVHIERALAELRNVDIPGPAQKPSSAHVKIEDAADKPQVEPPAGA